MIMPSKLKSEPPEREQTPKIEAIRIGLPMVDNRHSKYP
jgi:hypothetical protein